MDLHAHASDAAGLTERRFAPRLSGIYAIVNESAREPLELVESVLRAGVRIVQYRAKAGIVPQHAQSMRASTRRYGALFLLNDEWRRVVEFDADGVHLGPDDAAPGELRAVRRAIGQRVIGLSCGEVDEVRRADPSLVDYVGVGSVYATASKSDAGDPIGIEGLRRVAAATTLPVAAIGGITAANIVQVRESGVAMAAVISAIAAAPNPQAAARELVALWNA